jgi:hypothetical protein
MRSMSRSRTSCYSSKHCTVDRSMSTPMTDIKQASSELSAPAVKRVASKKRKLLGPILYCILHYHNTTA